MIPQTGRRFGPYEIQTRLGGGGMGHVFRAWDARLHREVAVKLLQDEYAMPGMRERFLREARAASALNHPNICTIFDIGEQDGDPYLVMELLQGITLKDRIQSRTVQVDEIICIGREVAEALGAAHAKGVIHRDIKPANIFLVDKSNGNVQAKVLDFGLAKIEGGVLGARGRSLDITTAGATVGTLAYMSPEQARGEVLDSRSDLFSLGVVLYEMATRRIPFPGATSALVFVKLLNHPPEPVREWNEAIPRELEKIILKLMSKERTARFQTARELEEALDRLNGKPPASWLRKAVATVPLVRAPDPVARDRRAPTRRGNDSRIEPSTESLPTSPPSEPSRVTPDEAQLLRPVARVPRGDTSARPPAEPAIAESSLTADEAPLPLATSHVEQTGERASEQLPSVSASSENSPVSAPPTSSSQGPTERDVLGKNPSGGTQLHSADDLGLTSTSATEFSTFAPAGTETVETEEASSTRTIKSKSVWIAAAAVVLVVLGIAIYFVVNRGRFSAVMLTERDPVVLTEVENHTGVTGLDGAVLEGLQIALSQSPYLLLRSNDSYRTARRLTVAPAADSSARLIARNAAQRIGARAYLFGSVKGAAPQIVIHMDVIRTEPNEIMSSAEETADSLGHVPDALSRLARELRANVGEDSDSIDRTSNALDREGTTDVEALALFARAESALADGRNLEALSLYQQTVARAPQFIQAQLRMVVLYSRQRAEVASADTARIALAAADHVGDRTRAFAQYQYEMNATGDYVRATTIIRQLLAAYPHDARALEDLARAFRLQGRMAEALTAAQQAYAEEPLDIDASIQAENAFVGLDRYDAAYQLEEQLQRLGLGHVGGTLTSSYLEGRPESVSAAIKALEVDHPGFRPNWNYGLYLDNIGHLSAGAAIWTRGAEAARKVHGFDSASAFLLSQGALDHALLGDCEAALNMAHSADALPEGLGALFNSGMSNGLCGDSARAAAIIKELNSNYPASFAVNSFYVADIRAAIALHASQAAAALEALKSARQFDLISLTPYLRGRAHVALRQSQIGIVDFQTVLAHRGVTFIVGSDVYPAAQIGVARAFADTGDTGNSAQAYRRFLDLWSTADPGQPLIAEARFHSR